MQLYRNTTLLFDENDIKEMITDHIKKSKIKIDEPWEIHRIEDPKSEASDLESISVEIGNLVQSK